jgi:hypothetical protein
MRKTTLITLVTRVACVTRDTFFAGRPKIVRAFRASMTRRARNIYIYIPEYVSAGKFLDKNLVIANLYVRFAGTTRRHTKFGSRELFCDCQCNASHDTIDEWLNSFLSTTRVSGKSFDQLFFGSLSNNLLEREQSELAS